MPKVIMVCGRICSGKSTYASRLHRDNGAAVLSVDELMLTLFGQHCGDMHDEYAKRTQNYLFCKSVELIESGIDVILDWGFWTKAARTAAREFYMSRGIMCEFHYVDIDDDTWRERIKKRNAEVASGDALAYYVDEGLAAKFAGRFEQPECDEIEVYVKI
ncbi:MAG: ATP-binding protein [Clostridia bacterium]|nr:ATP-binding protein [Clostridia bacterium]